MIRKFFARLICFSFFLLTQCAKPAGVCNVSADCASFETCFNGICVAKDEESLLEVCEYRPDLPDDEFKDTNCDGIDGNAATSVFVSPLGEDSNAGDKANPVKTLKAALASGKAHILMAAGTYEAPLETTKASVKLYGGYDTQWARSDVPERRARVVVPSKGWALTGLSAESVLERIEIVAEDATEPSQPSQALRVVNSGSFLTLRHVQISPGKGAAGRPGTEGAAGTPGTNGGRGNSAESADFQVCVQGGTGAPGNSLIGDSGGNGGQGACRSSSNGNDGSSANSSQSALNAKGGAGGVFSGCGGAGGVPGVDGDSGAEGAPGVNGLGVGSIDSSGTWVARPDMFGTTGKPGLSGRSGGGGGGGSAGSSNIIACQGRTVGGGGGGGGGGGAGGNGGTGGDPGGASIGMALSQSSVTLEHVEFKAEAGGNGGMGGAGGVGGAAGNGGEGGTGGIAGGAGGKGGNGGSGGNGGKGGKGAQGPAVGIWCTENSTVSERDVDFTPSTISSFISRQGCP